MTYEQAQNFLPQHAAHPVTMLLSLSIQTHTFSGAREPMSRNWHPTSRAEFGFNKPDRSWKRHRRLQRGSLRIK